MMGIEESQAEVVEDKTGTLASGDKEENREARKCRPLEIGIQDTTTCKTKARKQGI